MKIVHRNFSWSRGQHCITSLLNHVKPDCGFVKFSTLFKQTTFCNNFSCHTGWFLEKFWKWMFSKKISIIKGFWMIKDQILIMRIEKKIISLKIGKKNLTWESYLFTHIQFIPFYDISIKARMRNTILPTFYLKSLFLIGFLRYKEIFSFNFLH